MGKIRIKTLGDEEKEKKQKKRDEARREGKKIAKKQEVETDLPTVTDKPVVEKTAKNPIEPVGETAPSEKPVKAKLQKKISRSRSRRYLKVRGFVDKN